MHPLTEQSVDAIYRKVKPFAVALFHALPVKRVGEHTRENENLFIEGMMAAVVDLSTGAVPMQDDEGDAARGEVNFHIWRRAHEQEGLATGPATVAQLRAFGAGYIYGLDVLRLGVLSPGVLVMVGTEEQSFRR